MRNPHFGVSLDVGYEPLIFNFCVYLLVILNIFKSQNCRLPAVAGHGIVLKKEGESVLVDSSSYGLQFAFTLRAV